ncbi:MAG: hypothetical protein GF331_02565 [Chitinivibrionales bacterium]|nr:hypothetical protein [Chitinivibrionales bacterium]
MHKLGWLFSLGVLLMLASCGDDEEPSTAPDGFNTTDEAAVRAILDANGLTEVRVNQVARYELIGGEYRYVELGLVNEEGYFGENAGVVIDTIPPEIGYLTRLTRLRFSHMQVRSLPPQIGQLQSLTTLLATGNQLTSLPVELFSIPTLQILRVDSNQITVLPSEVGNATSLQNLRVASNELTQLPSTLMSLTNLSNFDFDDNRICTMEPAMVSWIHQFGVGTDWVTATHQRCP